MTDTSPRYSVPLRPSRAYRVAYALSALIAPLVAWLVDMREQWRCGWQWAAWDRTVSERGFGPTSHSRRAEHQRNVDAAESFRRKLASNDASLKQVG